MHILLAINQDPSSAPIRQHRKLLRIMESYATALFDAEAKRYPSHHKGTEQWLGALALETFETMTDRLRFARLGYHASEDEIKATVIEAIRVRANAYISSVLGPLPLELPEQSGVPKVKTMPSTIASPKAARKLEDYLNAKGIGLTDFASRAQTTDRTLRSFRKTGKVRRNIFASIAKAMGTTTEDLLK